MCFLSKPFHWSTGDVSFVTGEYRRVPIPDSEEMEGCTEEPVATHFFQTINLMAVQGGGSERRCQLNSGNIALPRQLPCAVEIV